MGWRLMGLGLALLAALAGSAGWSHDKGTGKEVPATGKAVPALASIDRLMTSFLAQHDLPGAAVAVARNGRLVYARGFGHADRDKGEVVRPDALFRIASVSKPLTAVAVLQLVERGKLKLNDHVFKVLGLEEPKEPQVPFDPRWKYVTILELLQHTGGWDRDKAFDPMFVSPDIVRTLKVPPPALPDAIIRYMLRRPLQFDPGEGYSYSNFGYCLLGRIIEKASGQSYEEYVRKEVLAPLGVKQLRLGKTLPAERARGEVKYYVGAKKTTGRAVMGPNLGKQVPLPYGAWCIEAMDAHGGWLATAPDLVRFAAAFEDPARCPLLGKNSIDRMFGRPRGVAGFKKNGKPRESYYGCGWEVVTIGPGQFNYWHTGLLDGTSTLLVHRFDGLTWAILFNGTGPKDTPAGLIDGLMHEAVDAVKNWPRGP
jgi:N-acyl-D-amino-acid deacylase